MNLGFRLKMLQKLKNFKKIVNNYRYCRTKKTVCKKIQERIRTVENYKISDREIKLMYDQSVQDFLRAIAVKKVDDSQMSFGFDLSENSKPQEELL